MNRRFTAAEYREFIAAGEGKRTNKYRAKQAFRCEGCGGQCADRKKRCPACGHDEIIRFDSRAEARRYDTLRRLEILGAIVGLRRQVPMDLNAPGGGLIGRYVMDFVYLDRREEGQTYVYEDVKGQQTPLSAWKVKHFEAQYGTKVVLIRRTEK